MEIHFHRPPNCPWDPNAISDQLRKRSVDATTVDDMVRIRVVVPVDRSWIGTILEQLLPGRAGLFSIDIHHNPSKFIRNIELKHDVTIPFDVCRIEIHETLASQGIACLTDELESRLAREYCKNESAIQVIEREISIHEKNKEALVTSQDFDGAFHERELEYNARNRLDTLLRESYSNST